MKQVIEKYAGLPFSAATDCCQFVGECLEANGHENLARRFEYDTHDEADAIIERHGLLSDLLTSLFGAPQADDPQDGDVVVIYAGRQVAGMVWRNRIVCRTRWGLMDYPLGRALFSWRP